MRFFFMMLLGMLMVLVEACYPDAQYEYANNKGSMRLPLTELGVETDAQAVQRWLTWSGEDSAAPFDMGESGNNFALDIRLYSEELNAYQAFEGVDVILDRSSGDDVLTVDLKIPLCTDCTFSVFLFWKEDPNGSAISVFDGESSKFSVQDYSDSVILPPFSIRQTGVGTVTCNEGQGSTPDGAWIALRDDYANIRFPHVVADSSKQPMALITDVPVGHSMVVEMDPLADGRFYSSIDSVTLTQDNQDETIELP